MKIAIGCDHGGIALKPAIVEELKRRGVDIVDVGCYDTSSVDYPDYGAAVARKVASGECDKGILMCGTGIGISIAANKFKGIRAGVVHDEFTAQMIAEHNAANVIALGGRIVSPEQAGWSAFGWIRRSAAAATPAGSPRSRRSRKKTSNKHYVFKQSPVSKDGVLTCKLFVKNRPDPLDKRRYGCIILADEGKSRRIQK